MSESQQADKPLSQRQHEQLDRHIAARVDDLLRGLHERVGEQVRAANQGLLKWLESHMPELPPSFVGDFDITQLLEAPSPPPAESPLDEVLEAVAAIDGKTDQAEILTTLLEEGLRFASRTAFFLIRHGQVRGWAGRGFELDQTASFSGLASAEPWAKAAEKNAAVALDEDSAAGVSGALGSKAGAALVVPFAIRGAISGALWAESDPGAALEATPLQLLTHAAAMALETAAVSPGPSPALRLEGELPATAPGEGEAAPEEPVLETPHEAAVAAVEEEPVAPDEAPQEPAPVVEAESPAIEAAGTAEPETQFEMAPSAIVEPTVEPAVDTSSVEELAVEEPAVEEPAIEQGVPEETAPVETVDAGYVAPVEADAGAPPEEEPGQLYDDDAQTEYVAVDDDDAPAEEDRYLPTDDEIALEAEPEPELEDTNIWELEEEEEEDEEPTQVGMAVQTVAPEADVPAEPQVEAPPAEAAPIGQETVRIDVAKIQQDQEKLGRPEPPPSDPGDETSPTMHALPHVASDRAGSPTATPVPVEPPPPDPAPAQQPSPSSFAAPAPPSSFASSPSSFAQPEPAPSAPPPDFASPPPPEPEPAQEAKPEAVGGSTEVVPPPDLDGPGLAFATPEPDAAEQRVDEGDAALHEEARRLARLLVSEIKLYNEEIIEEGRRSGNIYERLKDDIDRSRQMYEERIDPRLADQEDYFYQELVQRLAGGEERLLGM